MAQTRPSAAKRNAIRSYRDFERLSSAHDVLDTSSFRIGETFTDELDVHRRLAGLPGALAVDSVLAHQHQGVGQ